MSTTTVAAPATTVPEGTRERCLRGLILHADHEITPLGHGLYEVHGYTLDLDVFADEPRETCSCPDHKRTGTTCKHLVAASIYRARSRAAARRVQRPKFAPETVAANLERMGA